MPLICYVLREGGAAPYMEILPEQSLEGAARRAEQLLAERPNGLCAELWEDNCLVCTVGRRAA